MAQYCSYAATRHWVFNLYTSRILVYVILLDLFYNQAKCNYIIEYLHGSTARQGRHYVFQFSIPQLPQYNVYHKCMGGFGSNFGDMNTLDGKMN